MDLEKRLKAIESAVCHLAEDMSSLGASLGAVQAQAQMETARRDQDPSRMPMRDQVWACQNCGARMGIYDPETDQLRVRYKDFVCYITPGVGGTVKVPCRRCGLENKLADTRMVRTQ